MPRSWTSTPELHLDLDTLPPRGRRTALERAVRQAVQDGRLVPGAAMPSSRALARDLGLSRRTVVDAYSQLVAEGYLITRAGADTAVADHAGTHSMVPAAPPAPTRIRVDLRPGWLDLAATFPRTEWLRAERRVLHSAPDEAFDYSDPRGRPELRAELASYLGRVRGVVTSPEHVVICAGFAHGLSLIASALRSMGTDAVAMEDPCNPVHRDIVHRHQLDIVTLPVDEAGAQVDTLHRGKAQAVMLTPAHQYPTGGTLHPDRRAAIVHWARSTGAVIIEDDYDGEFRYDRQPVGALQGLDPDHVIYAGTTSKTLAPGIRVGWLVVPARLLEPITEAVRLTIASPSSLQQLVLADLLTGGHLDRHLRRLRAGYRARRDQLVAALDASVPRLRSAGIAAGLHLLVYLSDSGATERQVRAITSQNSVAIGYLTPYWHHPGIHEQGILIGYARPAATAFTHAVEELVSALRAATS